MQLPAQSLPDDWFGATAAKLEGLPKHSGPIYVWVFKNGVNDRQTDRHLYLVIKLRVVPSGAKSNLLSTGALSTKIYYLHGTLI